MSHNGWLDPCETREDEKMAKKANKETRRSEVIKYIIKGIKSGDCQTELYALKACLLLMNYKNMFPDVVFYRIACVLMSYIKFFDE